MGSKRSTALSLLRLVGVGKTGGHFWVSVI